MKRTLELELDPKLIERAEEKAAQAGLNCGDYVRSLIERDLTASVNDPHQFASEDLVGSYELNDLPATNERVRMNLKKCLNTEDAGNR